MSSSASQVKVLPEGAGWAVVVGLGFAFAGFMLLITWLQEQFTDHSVKSNDEFISASHSVKPGLIASGIVSAWTWAATLLQSSTMTFKYGVSGAYWYAGGAMIQILLCAIMACRLKSCAPYCNTFLEVIRIRHGKAVHAIFMCFSLATNLLVSSQLVLGGAAVVDELTGMNTTASLFLIPISVAVYTVTGGLRATFIADYTHTVALLVIIMYFFFNVWTGHGKIGSLTHMASMLADAAKSSSVEGHAGGSYLTMRSREGLVFGITNICGNLATVFCDQSYHQRSVASQPKTAARGFLLGGSAWFPIPFLFATTMGLAARALSGHEGMPQLTDDQVTAGLAAPSAAVAICGKSGAVAVLILLFLAVTSAASAQQIAVSSVFTYDVYKVYIAPKADGRHIQLVSHATVLVWAIIMAAFGVIWNEAGISLGWLYLMMGIIIAPAVFPIFGSLVWSKTNPIGCVIGMITGLGLGVMTWMVTAHGLYGKVTVDTTGYPHPNVAGNLVSLLVSLIITVVVSVIWPQNYDFGGTRAFKVPEQKIVALREAAAAQEAKARAAEPASEPGSELAKPQPVAGEQPAKAADKLEADTEKAVVSSDDYEFFAGPGNIELVRAAGLDPAKLGHVLHVVQIIAVSASLCLVIVIPVVAQCARVWTPKGLGAWVYLGFVWLCWSALVVGVLPLWESRHGIGHVLVNMFTLRLHRRRRAQAREAAAASEGGDVAA